MRDGSRGRRCFGPLLAGSMLLSMAFTAYAADATLIYKQLTIEDDVQADGLYTQIMHSEIWAPNDSVARGLGEIPIQYSESMEDVDIVEAYTLKANGAKLPVDTGAIFSQLAPGSPQVPMFNDQRRKVIVFPDLSGGDTIVFTVKRRSTQARFPNHFLSQFAFPRTLSYPDVQITIRAPKILPLEIDAHEMTFDKTNEGDSVIYRARYSAPDALSEDEAAVSGYDRLPRYFVSSFKSYDDLGRAYYNLAAGKIAVSPKIQAAADQMTTGTADRREQAQKIYEWVSKHIRYVAVILGNGGLVPHEPDAILSNGYGDCKDHTVLFAALLKAKHIDSEVVLINAGDGYTLSDVPTLAELNHAISWLPEFKLYADTTAGVAPFGLLPMQEYGKSVVHAVAKGKALRQIPILRPDSASIAIKTVEQLAADGTISGATTTTARGPLSIQLRMMARAIQAAGPERAAKAQLKSYGLDGTGSFALTSPDDLAASYTVTGTYKLDPRPHFISGDGFAPPTGLWLVARPGGTLMGQVTRPALKDTEPTPCHSGQITEELSIELPADKHLSKLPADNAIATDNMKYTAAWSISGQTITVRRTFTAHVEQPLCTGKIRADAAAALSKIRDDYRTQIALTSD